MELKYNFSAVNYKISRKYIINIFLCDIDNTYRLKLHTTQIKICITTARKM
jgi:hypothetical protein